MSFKKLVLKYAEINWPFVYVSGIGLNEKLLFLSPNLGLWGFIMKIIC